MFKRCQPILLRNAGGGNVYLSFERKERSIFRLVPFFDVDSVQMDFLFLCLLYNFIDKSVISMKTYSLTVYTDSLFNNKILSREWKDLRDKSLFPRIKIYV